MRIGIYGNMNNYCFLLAEGLRSIGHEVRLVVTRSDPLHHPVKGGLLQWLSEWIYDISDLGWPAIETQQFPISRVVDFLCHKADFVILNDTGPALHPYLHTPVVSVLTGSDLTYYASLESSAPRRAAWPSNWTETVDGQMQSEHWEQLVVQQRAGIRRSKAVSFPWRGLVPSGDALLDEIGVNDQRRTFLSFADVHRLKATPPPPPGPLSILNGARLNWVRPMPAGFSEMDYKGCDKLLQGFARFLREGGKGKLTLVEKGLHVRETRALADSLGLGEHIIWRREMPVQEFYEAMIAAHVICDNLGDVNPGMNALAGLAVGRPVISNYRLDAMGPPYPAPWPVCQSVTADDVADHLLNLYRHPDLQAQMGSDARRFAETYLSPEAAAQRLMDKLEQA